MDNVAISFFSLRKAERALDRALQGGNLVAVQSLTGRIQAASDKLDFAIPTTDRGIRIKCKLAIASLEAAEADSESAAVKRLLAARPIGGAWLAALRNTISQLTDDYAQTCLRSVLAARRADPLLARPPGANPTPGEGSTRSGEDVVTLTDQISVC